MVAVNRSATHSLQKPSQASITLIAGLGVEGDAHLGTTVQHLSLIKKDPTQPNVRQVHLIHQELHAELREKGFDVSAGQMGENITTAGIHLLGLPTGTQLHIGKQAVIEVTGLRNPCVQLDGIQEGLMKAVLDRDVDNNLIRKAGVMGVVLQGGEIVPGDKIEVRLPALPHFPLEKV